MAPCHPAQYMLVIMSCSVIWSTYICRCITLNYSERCLQRTFHSCRFDSHTECVVCPSIFLRFTLFSTDGFAGECCTTWKSSPSPINSTRSVGSPRACPHSQTRPLVSGHNFVPVVSSLTGASGRIINKMPHDRYGPKGPYNIVPALDCYKGTSLRQAIGKPGKCPGRAYLYIKII